MNKTLFLLLVLISIATTLPTTIPNPDEGLVAYYSFNNCDARDETDGGSDGILHGNISCWCGVEGNGLLLDGLNSYIEFEGLVNNYFNTTDFTLSFYFRPMQKSIFRESLISKRSSCEKYNMLDLQFNRQAEKLQIEFHETPSKSYGDISPEIEGKGWYHFALVREGIFASTYINGQLQKEGRRCSGVDIDNVAVLAFGDSPCIQTGGTRRFKGILDELRVYDRALSPEEMQLLYARFPVENAMLDCVTYNDKKIQKDFFLPTESMYLCSAKR